MRTQEIYTDYQDHFEYFGNTEIERIRMQGENVIKHDWIMFDTIDEAMEFFNDRCGEWGIMPPKSRALDLFNNVQS